MRRGAALLGMFVVLLSSCHGARRRVAISSDVVWQLPERPQPIARCSAELGGDGAARLVIETSFPDRDASLTRHIAAQIAYYAQRNRYIERVSYALSPSGEAIRVRDVIVLIPRIGAQTHLTQIYQFPATTQRPTATTGGELRSPDASESF